MAGQGKLITLLGLVAGTALLRQTAFVPAPRSMKPAAAAGAAAMLGASPVFADEIGEAAKKLGDASYSFAKEVDWNNGLYLQAPGAFKPFEALKAIDKMIVMGAQADPKLLQAAAVAHHKAIGNIGGPNGMTSLADWNAVNAALGRVFASVPESTVMDVYNSVSAITDAGVPAYLKSLVNSADADKAYAGFLEFKDVVKKNQVAAAGPSGYVKYDDRIGSLSEGAARKFEDRIGQAATKLADASYPFLKKIDWDSDIYMKSLPGVTAQQAMKAVDKTIVMGSLIDGELLKAAAEAHHKAIGSIDAEGVTSAADYAGVNAALGRVIASVPASKVMDVYNAWAGLLNNGVVPNKMFSLVNPLDASAAAKAFYEFKDVVKSAQVQAATGGYTLGMDFAVKTGTVER